MWCERPSCFHRLQLAGIIRGIRVNTIFDRGDIIDTQSAGILGAAFAEANPGVTVTILPSLGSGGGIKAVLAGAIDIGLSARPSKATERDAGESHLANLG